MNPDFESLSFELKDIEIFKIPDVRTKLDIIQNYFFPRLEILIKESLEDVQNIYQINPYEKMSFVYLPNHRKNSKTNLDIEHIHIGISGKRSKNRELIVKRKSGKPATLHSSYLVYEIHPDGTIMVVFNPFRNYVVDNYIRLMIILFEKSKNKIEKILRDNGISYTMGHNLYFDDFLDAIINGSSDDDLFSRYYLHFYSPTYYFPVSRYRGLWELKRAFVALYPLLDAFITVAEGQEYPLDYILDRLIESYWDQEYNFSQRKERVINDDQEKENVEIHIPELDNYKFIRTGLWWDVLARDKWKCCSCGRSTKEHGVTLHVDHIIPRSKGGTDTIDNLQTLCWKCNIGKSNRDTTDLR